ncbi:MAG TPA: F0F1 ATP synthase subunit A [Longimicrobium sp.]|jgi:F-type H+-transporting ATPase subunit a|uniref:F0F1 ATP synthase subunit A n=1 Tax=Longimicrobium sp. TaxID=2029185 RepID=UPI002ED9ED0A
MKLTTAIFALLFAAAPVAAQAGHGETHAPAAHGAADPAAQRAVAEGVREGSETGHAGAGAGHAAGAEGEHSKGFDAMHHVRDGQSLDFPPFGSVALPARGSWMVGPVDMTPSRHVVFMLLAAALLLLVFIPAGRAAARREKNASPGGRRHNVAEVFALYIRDNVVIENIGHGGEKYTGFVLSLFFFILFSNLLGLLPYGASATGNISVTVALALITFLVVEVSGMRALGPKGYLKTIVYIPPGLGPVMSVIMAIVMTPVELLGKLAKPFALAVRLMANIMAGHIVLLSLFGVGLVFGWGFFWGPFVMAAGLTFLELFVAFLQAYVFCVLTSVFIGMIRHAH